MMRVSEELSGSRITEEMGASLTSGHLCVSDYSDYQQLVQREAPAIAERLSLGKTKWSLIK